MLIFISIFLVLEVLIYTFIPTLLLECEMLCSLIAHTDTYMMLVLLSLLAINKVSVLGEEDTHTTLLGH